MSWRDRLKKTINLTSPDGNVFDPLWSGNARMVDKKLGIFEYPQLDGTITQDLGIAGTRYPLTLLFEGDDNDVESNRFFESAKERGLWKVHHPVRGVRQLQLVSVSEQIEPVKSGNLTVIVTEWIEPIDPAGNRSRSKPQLASQILTQTDALNISGSAQFVENTVQDAAAETLAIQNTTNAVINAVDAALSPLYESVSDLNGQILAVIASIQATITETTIDTLALAGQVQNLVQLPVLASTDIAARLTAYTEMIVALALLSPVNTTTEDKNVITVQELALTASLGALATTATTGILQTRPQAIDAMENISANFNGITDQLDLSQTAFQAVGIEFQYFSQSSSYNDAAIIVAQAIAYLLVATFDLAIEKRIILERQRAPIEITITEYGTLGTDDEHLDLFVESNKLVGSEMLILPTGKEVVVYV